MPIRLMKPVSLARLPHHTWEESIPRWNLRYPLLASPKYDGIRGATPDGVPQSNSGKPFPNWRLMELLSTPVFRNLDFEMVAGNPCDHSGGGVCHRSLSVVMSEDRSLAELKFYVFDRFAKSSFDTRISTLVSHHPQIEIVPQTYIPNAERLSQYVTDTLAEGYEGVILRDPSAPYKHGRSTLREGGMLRIKPREDTEARIIGFKWLEINENTGYASELGYTKRSSAKSGKVPTNLIGSVMCRDPRWPEDFGVTIADHEQRRVLAALAGGGTLIGKIAKFSYMPYGSIRAPRQPSFLSLRSPIDLDPDQSDILKDHL